MLNQKIRIVITGVGPLASNGIGKHDFWKAILHKKVSLSKSDFKVGGELWDSFYFHKIDHFNINDFGIRQELLEEINNWKKEEVLDLQYLMAAAKLAIDDSGLDITSDGSVGLVLSHESPGIDQFAEKAFSFSYDLLQKKKDISKKEFYENVYSHCGKSVYDLQTFMFLFHIGKALGINGISFFLNNACASGLYSLEAASMLIKNEHVSSVVLAAADHPDIFKYLWFKQIGMYASDGLIKPFASNADGIVFGDGGAGLVLENFENAKRRGAHIYAEYLGGAFVSEGWKVTLPAVGSNLYRNIIEKALKKSAVTKDDLDLIVPHGVGIKVTDRYEADTLCSVFNNFSSPPLYSAFKPYVGHNLGGSSLLETVILLLAMENSLVPATLNCSEKNRDVEIVLLTKEHKKMTINLALKTACAFAGFDAAVLFKKVTE